MNFDGKPRLNNKKKLLQKHIQSQNIDICGSPDSIRMMLIVNTILCPRFPLKNYNNVQKFILPVKI